MFCESVLINCGDKWAQHFLNFWDAYLGGREIVIIWINEFSFIDQSVYLLG